MAHAAGSIFTGVSYFLSPTYTAQDADQIREALDSHGAARACEAQDASHVITNSSKFEGWDDVESSTAVVTKMGRKICHSGKGSEVGHDYIAESSKVQFSTSAALSPKYYSPNPEKIFSGIVATSSGLSDHDVEILSAGIHGLGGRWSSGLTNDCTHLFVIGQGTSSDKYHTALHFQPTTGIKVLLPHWFDDAMRLGHGELPTKEYEWPEPTALYGKESVSENRDVVEVNGNVMTSGPKLDPTRKSLYRTAAMATLPENYKVKDVWQSRKILLSSSLDLASGRREAVEASIFRSGGTILELESTDAEEEIRKVDAADILVTKWRSGTAYINAIKHGKTVGTLSWIFHVQSTGTISPPLDQLLHFPTPRTPIEGFASHEITITNYTGDAREYIKKLIITMGANFTPSMSGKNTVLVAAYLTGHKTSKARNWSIPIVNHTWLEDCFAQWRNLTPATEKYIIFPPGIDFLDVLGQRGLGDIDLLAEAEAELNDHEAPSTLPENLPTSSEKHALNPAIASSLEVVEINGDNDDEPISRSTQAATTGKGGGTLPTKRDKQPQPREISERDGLHSTREDKGKTKAIDLMSSGEEDVNMTTPKRKGKLQALQTYDEEFDSDEEHESPLRGRGTKTRIRKLDIIPMARGSDSQGESELLGNDERNMTQSRIKLQQPQTVAARKRLPNPPPQPVASTSTAIKRRIHEVDEEHTEAEDDSDAGEVQKSPKKTKRSSALKRVPSVIVPPLIINGKVVSPSSLTPKSAAKARVIAKTGSIRAIADQSSTQKRFRTIAAEKGRSCSSTPPPPDEHSVSEEDSRARLLLTVSVNSPKVSPGPQLDCASKVPNISGSPPKRSRRNAAVKATKKLREDVMPDVLNYEQQKRNAAKRGLDRGLQSFDLPVVDRALEKEKEGVKRQRTINAVDEELEYNGQSKKRRVSENGLDDDDNKRRRPRTSVRGKGKRAEQDNSTGDSDEQPVLSPKKRTGQKVNIASTSPLVQSSTQQRPRAVNVLTTTCTLDNDTMRALVKLGVKEALKPEDCTHLIVTRIARTEKFLVALSFAPFILTKDWAVQSAKAKRLLPEKDFALDDRATEDKYNFKLSDAISRAANLRGALFAGHVFYLSRSVNLDFLDHVISACGGKLQKLAPTKRVLENGLQKNGSNSRHFVSCEKDRTQWWEAAEAGHPIYTTEIILTSALRQEVDWDSEEFRVPGSL